MPDESDRRAVLSADADAAGPGERLELAEALARLRPGHRAVVLLVDVHGFGYDEVGAMLDIAPGTVGSRLNRAHRVLRHLLAADDSYRHDEEDEVR